LLIIFDLDDTLIDTSGCIIPVKLEEALQRMIEMGLFVPDFQEAAALIKRLDRASESSQRTLSEFLEIMNADKRFLEAGLKEVYENFSPELFAAPLENALQVLNDLGELHRLALVTVGKEEQQHNKLKKAGIDSGIFSKIIVSETANKMPHYQLIIDEFGYAPSEVIVCGDRVERDLAPARELGCRTVQMRWGRGLSSTGKIGDVDYYISNLSELKEIIEKIDSFSSF